MPSLWANGSLLSKRHGKSVGGGGSEIGLQKRGCFLKLCASAAELRVVTLMLLFPAPQRPRLGQTFQDPRHGWE